jgi:hypothetical protein
MAQRPGLSPEQPPPLPLIQVREDHLELRRQHLRGNFHRAYTTQACPIPGSYGLFCGKPLAISDHLALIGCMVHAHPVTWEIKSTEDPWLKTIGCPAPQSL